MSEHVSARNRAQTQWIPLNAYMFVESPCAEVHPFTVSTVFKRVPTETLPTLLHGKQTNEELQMFNRLGNEQIYIHAGDTAMQRLKTIIESTSV